VGEVTVGRVKRRRKSSELTVTRREVGRLIVSVSRICLPNCDVNSVVVTPPCNVQIILLFLTVCTCQNLISDFTSKCFGKPIHLQHIFGVTWIIGEQKRAHLNVCNRKSAGYVRNVRSHANQGICVCFVQFCVRLLRVMLLTHFAVPRDQTGHCIVSTLSFFSRELLQFDHCLLPDSITQRLFVVLGCIV
jgi:hypothetical protein